MFHNSRYLKYLLVYIINVFLLFLISSFFHLISMDDIWSFGFSYNIANGLIPYRDFNMIVGPFYNILISYFIKVFGNYILIFNLANSIICSLILTFAFYKLPKKLDFVYLIMVIGLSPCMFTYNTFCAVLVLAILILNDTNIKIKDFLIGIIIGMIIMTKQNIGFVLAFIYLFINKRNLKVFFSIFIPIIPILIYLILHHSLLSYIDLCYLGLTNFMDNLYIDIYGVFVLLIVYSLLIKDYFQTKNDNILYMIGFSIIVFPIVDNHHIITMLIPIVYYILSQDKSNRKFITKYFLLIGFIITILIIPIPNSEIFPIDSYLKFQRVTANMDIYLPEYSSYLNKYKNQKIYLFLDNSYLIKLYRNETLSFYDLINDGNMGKNEKKYVLQLENQCKNEKCLFILDNSYFNDKKYTQLSLIYKDWVLENANYLETLPSGDKVYTSY